MILGILIVLHALIILISLASVMLLPLVTQTILSTAILPFWSAVVSRLYAHDWTTSAPCRKCNAVLFFSERNCRVSRSWRFLRVAGNTLLTAGVQVRFPSPIPFDNLFGQHCNDTSMREAIREQDKVEATSAHDFVSCLLSATGDFTRSQRSVCWESERHEIAKLRRDSNNPMRTQGNPLPRRVSQAHASFASRHTLALNISSLIGSIPFCS